MTSHHCARHRADPQIVDSGTRVRDSEPAPATGAQNAAGDGAAPELNVALCLTLNDSAAEKSDIVQRASHAFAAMFGPTQHMDIVFLTDQQEAALKKVCQPIYIAMENA